VRCGAENPRFVRRRVRRNVSNPSAVPCDLTGEAGAARADDRADAEAERRARRCAANEPERAGTCGAGGARGRATKTTRDELVRLRTRGRSFFGFQTALFGRFSKQKIQPPPRAAAPR
jgi:hypothetical protein